MIFYVKLNWVLHNITQYYISITILPKLEYRHATLGSIQFKLIIQYYISNDTILHSIT